MQKIITFLGLGKGLTPYRHGDAVYEGEVFPQALMQFQPFDQMLVCLTAGARERTWELLEALGDDRIVAIDIPDGRTEAEIWLTFEVVIGHIDRDDQVIFDITHGLRSLPFQVFLFATYLKAAKNATIEAVYYGALELKDADGVAPVIDLSGFVGMLDWLTATDRFTQTGDGGALAGLIRDAMPSEEAMGSDKDVKRMGDHLMRAAGDIEQISLALAMTRPREVTRSAKAINRSMRETTRSLDAKVKPFMLVKDQVMAGYGQFAIDVLNDERMALVKQLEMVRWYFARSQFDHAVTLARELIVSVFCWKFGAAGDQWQGGRETVEQALNNLKYGRGSNGFNRLDERMQGVSNRNNVKEVWEKMGRLRNDIAHCGMTGREGADALRDRAIGLFPDFEGVILGVLGK